MVGNEDTSSGTSTGDEYSREDDVTFYHPPGAKASSSSAIWESLSDRCKRSIGSKFRLSKDCITMDVDAYSFVLSTPDMNIDKKKAIRDFLLSFGGASFGRCSYPMRITGSNSKDSMFGCAGNESQHLPYILRGNEMLVIDAPVKIALHASCQVHLIDSLKSKGFYYSPSSIKTGVCFDPYGAANKPPYSVMVDSIIDSCRVSKETPGNYQASYVIHVADMGFRLPITNHSQGISNLFKKCDKMQQTGIVVELTQFDIAFGFQAPQDHLIQAVCKVNESHDKESLFHRSQVSVYPLHKLPKLKNEILKKCDLKGTFEIKKTNWVEGRHICYDDDSEYVGMEFFSCSDDVENHREYLSIHSSTLFSVKGYSTISHSLLQKRARYPMRDKAMYGIGQKSIQHIQTLTANAALSLEETFNTVKSHGIGFRIEVSIRPHFNDPVRYSQHGNDVLLIVYLALQEFCGPKFSIRLEKFPTTSVQTAAMKLLSEVSSMIRSRKDIRFNQVYSEEKVTEWLRCHLSLLLITIGICPVYGIKYINQWLKDEDRFDPHNKVVVANPASRNDSLVLIKHRMLQKFASHLKQLKFSDRSIALLRAFLEKSPNEDPMSCFSLLGLTSKHLLVTCLWTDIIPHLSEFLSQDKNKVKTTLKESSPHEYDSNEMEYEDFLEESETSEAVSDKVLNDLMDKAPIPVHPLAVAITSLIKMSQLWNHCRLGYNQSLLQYVTECHKNDLLGHGDIADVKTLGLISNCLKGSKLSRDDFRHICLHLVPSCSARNQPIVSYQRMLCQRYHFPMSDIECTPTGSIAARRERNNLINQALSLDLSISVREDNEKTTFHRTTENAYIEIISQGRVLNRRDMTEYNTSFQHPNPYTVMAFILHSKSESCLRRILFDTMSKTKKNLKDLFLTSEGVTSEFFKKMNTLKELEQKHEFLLRKCESTIPSLVMSHRCEPEIVFSLVSFVFQKNIVFYDDFKNTTHVYMFWKSRSIKYQTSGCNWIATIPHVIIRRDHDNVFKFQLPVEPASIDSPSQRETSDLFSVSPIGGRISSVIRLNDLPNRHRTSTGHHFYAALCKLLIKIDSRYDESNPESINSDPLGLKSFILELSRSGITHHECFQESVVRQCNLLGLPLKFLSNSFPPNDDDPLPHQLLCPLLCLKNHNLIIGVFDSNDKKRETYFYALNPFSNKVETKTYPKFVRLLDRKQTLYLHSSPTRSEFFITEDDSRCLYKSAWSWDISLTGKYSHLSLYVFEKCLEVLEMLPNAKIYSSKEEIKDYNWRPEYPDVVVKSTAITCHSSNLSYLRHSGISHIALILIFPIDMDINGWDVCVVHHPCQDKEYVMHHASKIIQSSPSFRQYNLMCLAGKDVELCESGFYMILYAYLAIESKVLKNFLISDEAAQKVSDLKMKCQNWVQALTKTNAIVTVPWLSQLVWNQTTAKTNEKRNDPSPEQHLLSHKKRRIDITPNTSNVDHTPPRYIGISNSGNLCYMNVIIQLLHGMKCIRDHIALINTQDRQYVSMILKKQFHTIKTTKSKNLNLQATKNNLTRHPLFKDFNNNQQQDSHHFLLNLLQCLRNEFIHYYKGSKQFWFNSTLISEIYCQTCQTRSYNEGDNSSCIEIEIVGKNLRDCLSYFFRNEIIENQWVCSTCKKIRRGFKYLHLQERPILIITLKRFNSQSRKITKDIKFPIENLEIPNLVNTQYQSCENLRYNLFAVVNHLGSSSSSGHYTLHMKCQDKWLKFDDENVSVIRQERVNSPNAYMLVYIVDQTFKEIGS